MSVTDTYAVPDVVDIAYHGRSGSFSEEAALIVAESEGLGDDFTMIGLKDAQRVVRAVMSGTARLGVLGYRNTLSGDVGETQDALDKLRVRFTGSFSMPIVLALFALPGDGLEDICQVVSHPASLYQCEHTLLSVLPDAEAIAAPTSAAAADMLASGKLGPGTGVLCSRVAGTSRGLVIVRDNFHDSDANETTFVVFSRAPKRARRRKACVVAP